MPIYSRAVFKEQFPDEERQTKWKGWSYVRKGVYWCDRAYDMGARGGKVFKVDIDAWKGRGRTEGVWDVALAEVAEKQSEDEASSDEDEGSVASAGEESGDDDEEMDVDVDEAEEEDDKPKRKRRTTKATPAKKAKTTVPQKRKRKAAEEVKEPTRRRRAPHAKASPSRLPPTVEVDTLPTDPYERALRLLHVGATPESLPCREEEFVDVLSRVEEGIEGGGGGCLCKLWSHVLANVRHRRCARHRQNGNGACSRERTEAQSGGWRELKILTLLTQHRNSRPFPTSRSTA